MLSSVEFLLCEPPLLFENTQSATSDPSSSSSLSANPDPWLECCGPNSEIDDRCNDPNTDPHKGLGCMGCNKKNCRLCGEWPYIPCEREPGWPCCGPNSMADTRCSDLNHDPYKGLGCNNGCGEKNCRLCGEGDYIPCERQEVGHHHHHHTTTAAPTLGEECCGPNSMIDDRCDDPNTDPHKGLGCMGCNKK